MASEDSQAPSVPAARDVKKKLSWLTIGFLTVAAVASIRGLPGMAEYGKGAVFFYILPAVVFLVPTSLVAAELATGWKGGVFIWVQEALGGRFGFLAIWLQWIQNVVWYPVVLAFAAGALAYLFSPDLAKNGLYTAIVILAVYLLATVIALRGINLSAIFGSWGMILGTLLPAAILIVLGIIFLLSGDKPTASFEESQWIPDMGNIAHIVLIVVAVLGYAGMEMNAVHARDMENPRKSYPKSLLLSVVLILVIYIPTTLAVAIAVPRHELTLTGGVPAAYDAFFHIFNIAWAGKIVTALLIVGAFAGVITWVAGPSRGLLLVGQHGYLPRYFQRTNKNDVQVHILIPQAGIVIALAALYLFIPNVSRVFVLLSAMAAQLYLIMYVLMFVSALRLRKTQPDVPRGYRTPAMWFVAGLGIVCAVVVFCLGFIPPSQFSGSGTVYRGVLIVGLVILGGAPLVVYAFKRDSWTPPEGVEAALGGAAGVHEDEEGE